MTSPASDALTPAYMVRVYATYISDADVLDEGVWRPESWADAEAGLVRHRTTGEVRSHGLMGVQDEEDTYVHLILTSSPVVLVAVDQMNKFYAYRVFRYEIPLETIRVPVTFKTWQWERPYKENEWTFVSAQSEITVNE
jgi:hypothetical protein